MFSPPVWFRYAAVAVVCFFAAIPLWPFPVFSDALVICGVIAVGGAIVTGIQKRRDPYDLNALREFDEKEEIRNLDVPDLKDVDQVTCMCCMRVYDVKYPACPHCAERRK